MTSLLSDSGHSITVAMLSGIHLVSLFIMILIIREFRRIVRKRRTLILALAQNDQSPHLRLVNFSRPLLWIYLFLTAAYTVGSYLLILWMPHVL